MKLRSSWWISICLVSFVFTTDAGAVERIVDRASLCSALFLTRPDEAPVRGDLRFHLNGMNADIFNQLQRLDHKDLTVTDRIYKLGHSLRPSQLVRRLLDRRGAEDLAAPNDRSVSGAFRNLNTQAWTPQTAPTVASMLGRLRQLNADFAEESVENITYGFTVRGEADINGYLDAVQGLAWQIDAETQDDMDREFPYLKPQYVVGHAAYLGFATWFWKGTMLPGLQQVLTTETPVYLTAGVLGVTAMNTGIFYPPVRKAITYGAGMVSQNAREYHLNAHSDDRAQDGYTYLAEVRKMIAEAPAQDNFVYLTTDVEVPKSFVTELTEAWSKDRPVDPKEVKDAIRRRRRGLIAQLNKESIQQEVNDPRRTLMVDLFLFFDRATNQPTLVSLVRVKDKLKLNVPRRPKRREKRAPIFKESGAFEPAG